MSEEEEQQYINSFDTSSALAKMMSSNINAGEKVEKILNYSQEE